MQLIRNNVKEIIFFVVELVMGILLLINPIGFTTGIIFVGGVGIVSMGIVCVYKYFRQDPVEAKKGQLFTMGLILLLAGLFCMLRNDWFITTFPILTVIYGIIMLLTGISKIQLMVDMLRLKSKKWVFAGINALVSVTCAIIILSSPFASTVVLWIFAGVSLIVEAVLDMVTMFLGNMEETEHGNQVEIVSEDDM